MKLDKEKYVEYIKDKDQIMNMRKVLDKIEIALNSHIFQSTDFMDPYQRKLAKSILNRFNDIDYKELGGIEEAERKLILMYPSYLQYEDGNSIITCLSIKGNISSLSHRDFLGGILNLGINRSKVGDILIHEECVQIVVKKEISDFILANLNRVGNQKVIVQEIPLNNLNLGNIKYKIKRMTISSLRLDVLISAAWDLSRKGSQKLIEPQKIKVNWEPIDKISKEIEEGDIVSVKGYGRFKLSSIEGISKKGRIRVELKLLK